MSTIRIIAEAGVNHNGDVKLAKKLVRTAKECGADFVKFQTFHVDELVSDTAAMAEYQRENTGADTSQKEMLRQLALKDDDFGMLADYCKEIGIGFLSTPFDLPSIRLLHDLQDIWKIPSGEITNYPYLTAIAKTGKEVLLSTGMCTMDEIEEAISVLKENGAGRGTVLHCTTDYPTAMVDVNLNAMLAIRKRLGCDVGYSDHTIGVEVAVAAAAMGATVIEKHFTLDKSLPGPDHKASAEPDEFAAMVRMVRNIESAMGDGIKQPQEVEKKNITIVRKSIFAAKPIRKGERFTEDNLTTKRPGDGMSPMRWNDLIGRAATKDYRCGDRIKEHL